LIPLSTDCERPADNKEIDMVTLDEHWTTRLKKIDFAFQPIVNIHSGICYGYEALLRNYLEAGFTSIGNLFDEAYNDGLLHKVDLLLREMAFTKYAALSWCKTTKLFYNLENRLFQSPDYDPGRTGKLLKELNLENENIIFEISERHELEDKIQTVKTLTSYRHQGYKIAVDDCGTGFSGLQLLYYTEPDCIKIDRFFIQDIESDSKKRLFVSSIVEIAHLMGSVVVAEGVETRKEYYSCRNIGCDLVQGYFVQKPQINLKELRDSYQEIEWLDKTERRNKTTFDKTLIKTEMTYIEPISIETGLIQVFEQFRVEKSQFFPVVNNNKEIVGIIRESSFKDFAYSRFGRQLLENPNFGGNIHRFTSKFPVADINSPIEKILKIFAQNDSSEGVLILDGLEYIGFLSSISLLKILNEKNLSVAREQNPLTKLPGNTLIYEYISKVISDRTDIYFLVYFDFDNFKSYNDKYGFRHGDRLILRFSELLRTASNSETRFVGHIGGDDFFLGIKGMSLDRVLELTRQIAGRFKHDAESFYNTKDRERGFIRSLGRNGQYLQAPLITVSSVILEIPESGLQSITVEDIGNTIAKLKTKAKRSEDHLYIDSISDSPPDNPIKSAGGL
jgi:diguanylate cyclase (GGDEF)-like protein